jgi:hypothetical protein
VIVFDLWLSGKRPAGIATQLGIPVDDVRPKIKAIQRVIRRRFGRDFARIYAEVQD